MSNEHDNERDPLIRVSASDTFPLETLPRKLRAFVSEAARTLPVSPDMIALPVLVTVGAAIGNTRTIRIKKDWIEPAALYGVLIADAGSMKSSALAMATEPIKTLQKTGSRRTWASDTTTEALAELLQENPKGLVVIHDELSAWLLSFNQYKSGGKGNDKQFYLSAWSGSPILVDRKGGAKGRPQPIQIDKPFLAVVGAIPPGVLASLREELGLEDGFVHRLLFVWPQPVPVRLTEASISPAAQKDYADLIKQLVEIDWPSEPFPQPLDFTPVAFEKFQGWHDGLMEELEQPDFPDHLKGFFAKLKGYCARLALIHALASDPTAEIIGEESVVAAIKQIEFFKGQAIKVADRIGLSVGMGQRGKVEQCKDSIVRALRRKGPSKRRDIQRAGNCSKEYFATAWDSLFKPELVASSDGMVAFSESSVYRQTDRPVALLLEPGTDRPTSHLTDPENPDEFQEDDPLREGGV